MIRYLITGNPEVDAMESYLVTFDTYEEAEDQIREWREIDAVEECENTYYIEEIEEDIENAWLF